MKKPTRIYLRELYLDAVRSSVEFYDANELHQFEWNNVSRRILAMLLAMGIIDEDSLLQAIHEGIVRTAKDLYESHTKLGSHIDHTGAQAFAYALHHGVFTEKQVARLDFDHGDTHESFVKKFFVADMPRRLLIELATEKTEQRFDTCA